MSRFLRMSYLVAGVAGLGFFVMSVLLLAVWPGRVLEQQITGTSPDHPLPLTASEKRGRVIYGREGCAYCHTQQIRYLDRDVNRFGAATLAWETIFDYPQLWGTRRIGPDLSREHAVRSADWQLSHLYSPRAVVADSVMPAFPWLFDGAPDRPKPEARDVLAPTETLGRNRALAGPEGEARARTACNCSEDEKHFAFGSPVLNASPAMARRRGNYPKLNSSADPARGHWLPNSAEIAHSPPRDSRRGRWTGCCRFTSAAGKSVGQQLRITHAGISIGRFVSGTAMWAPPCPRGAIFRRRICLPLPKWCADFTSGQPEPTLTQDLLDLGSRVYAAHCARHSVTAKKNMAREDK